MGTVFSSLSSFWNKNANVQLWKCKSVLFLSDCRRRSLKKTKGWRGQSSRRRRRCSSQISGSRGDEISKKNCRFFLFENRSLEEMIYSQPAVPRIRTSRPQRPFAAKKFSANSIFIFSLSLSVCLSVFPGHLTSWEQVHCYGHVQRGCHTTWRKKHEYEAFEDFTSNIRAVPPTTASSATLTKLTRASKSNRFFSTSIYEYLHYLFKMLIHTHTRYGFEYDFSSAILC